MVGDFVANPPLTVRYWRGSPSAWRLAQDPILPVDELHEVALVRVLLLGFVGAKVFDASPETDDRLSHLRFGTVYAILPPAKIPELAIKAADRQGNRSLLVNDRDARSKRFEDRNVEDFWEALDELFYLPVLLFILAIKYDDERSPA